MCVVSGLLLMNRYDLMLVHACDYNMMTCPLLSINHASVYEHSARGNEVLARYINERVIQLSRTANTREKTMTGGAAEHGRH